MAAEKIIQVLKKNFDNEIRNVHILNDNEVYVEVNSEMAYSVCLFVHLNMECSLISLFANDEDAKGGGMAVYYTFAIRPEGLLLIVKANLDNSKKSLKSITPEIHAANLYEREIRDMFGIAFEGHPDSRELVFHENWPENLNPLRKEFDGSRKPEFTDRTQEFIHIDGTGVFEVPVGPVHAGIIEPGHFRFSVAGEPIINLEAKLYYVHKGIEKLSEGQPFEKVLFIAERISGDETFSNSLAYCQAIEKIAGLENVPERAKYGRTVLGELERIYNHLGDIQGICVDVAYGFAAYQFGMMRRWMQMLNEEITGSRFLRSSSRPGGLRRDYIRDKENSILSCLIKLEEEFNETVKIIKENSLFIDRVENTGVLALTIAKDLNAVGPPAKAAGICADVRKDYPYAAYKEMDFIVPEHRNGDVNCRMNVKIEELNESIKIIRQAIEKVPSEGKFIEPVRSIEPYKFAFGLTESPRGENCHFVMSGENNTIFRYKIRTPSFCNWPVLCHAVKGNIIPDFPLINKSFNLSYAGNDL
ncbi:MAG TPA: NADH-quinone oxidoreductase subunit C [Clostridia bacterium]|nr:NADH-quinone oxidoreductase subunit C [Clostridia bacterium]